MKKIILTINDLNIGDKFKLPLNFNPGNVIGPTYKIERFEDFVDEENIDVVTMVYCTPSNKVYSPIYVNFHQEVKKIK